jgi:two-component system, NarL family, nitrate/nitrite response regulator NarL
MRALWIEDHQLIGDSLEVLLQVVMPELSVDKARDLNAAKSLVAAFPYELVLLDWWLGEQDGEGAIRALRQSGCNVPILIVSGDEREAIMQRALALGAVGYVSKAADPAALVDAIRASVSGEGGIALRPAPARKGGTGAQLPPLNVESVYPELTARQAEVFRSLMRGLSDKQIARDLGVSDTTVKSHVRAILQIVGVHKRGEAAYQARARGAGER